MRRSIFLISLLLVACQVISLAPVIQRTLSFASPSAVPVAGTLSARTTELVASPSPIHSAGTGTAAPPWQTGPAPLATWADVPQEKALRVIFHPDGALYVGDQVSIEVIAPPAAGLKDRKVSLSAGGPEGVRLGEAQFEPYGLGGRLQATFQWGWDTTGLAAGEHSLTFAVQPDGPVWMETVSLLPRGQLPPVEAQSSWAVAKSACCELHYLTHTAAERDLPSLLAMMDEQAEKVSQQMGMRLNEPAPVVLIPRLLGHGGFTGREIVLSYLDRNYIDGNLAVIFHHELVHYMDVRLGGELKPSMLVEGLAVYLSGGHYRSEPLLPRLAALLPPEPGCIPVAQALAGGTAQAAPSQVCGLNRFIPLNELIDHFYIAQHEIGYLEAGSLVEFMVDSWGWAAYSSFYRDIHPIKSPTAQPAETDSQSRAVEQASLRHFGISLAQLEDRFLKALKAEPVRAQDTEDIRLTVRYYDSARRYQLLLDPSAYFLNAWLPDSEQMRKRRIVADVLRSPQGSENSALETMLVTANADLQQGRYAEAQRLLDAIDAILNGVSLTATPAAQ